MKVFNLQKLKKKKLTSQVIIMRDIRAANRAKNKKKWCENKKVKDKQGEGKRNKESIIFTSLI